MPYMTFYLWQFKSTVAPGWDGATVESLCEAVKALTPAGWLPAVQVKAHSGSRWQGAFDSHQLAVTGPDKLTSLRDAFGAGGVAFSVWGEPRGEAPGGGELAGVAQQIAGYYCADVEPYSDFDIDPSAEYAEAFWQAYRSAGGASGVGAGVSLVPLPSGLDPFGSAGLRAWLRPVRYVEPQCYSTMNSDLHPAVAIPYLRQRMKAARSGAKRVCPIVSIQADWHCQSEAYGRRWGAGVWRI